MPCWGVTGRIEDTLQQISRTTLSPRPVSGLISWRVGVADMVREGLDKTIALKSMTVEPAASMGQEEVVGPLVAGMAANFIFVSGDPLDPLAEVVLVVEDGKTVYDREREEQEEGR